MFFKKCLFLTVLRLHCHEGFSLVVSSGGCTHWLPCAGLSFWWLLLLRGTGSREFQELQLMGSVAAAPGLWRTDSVAVVCVLSWAAWGSSGTGDGAQVLCTARQSLTHCTTRKVPVLSSICFWKCMRLVYLRGPLSPSALHFVKHSGNSRPKDLTVTSPFATKV